MAFRRENVPVVTSVQKNLYCRSSHGANLFGKVHATVAIPHTQKLEKFTQAGGSVGARWIPARRDLWNWKMTSASARVKHLKELASRKSRALDWLMLLVGWIVIYL